MEGRCGGDADDGTTGSEKMCGGRWWEMAGGCAWVRLGDAGAVWKVARHDVVVTVWIGDLCSSEQRIACWLGKVSLYDSLLCGEHPLVCTSSVMTSSSMFFLRDVNLL